MAKKLINNLDLYSNIVQDGNHRKKILKTYLNDDINSNIFDIMFLKYESNISSIEEL